MALCMEAFTDTLPIVSNGFHPYSLSIVTEQSKSFKIQQLPLLSRELGLSIQCVFIVFEAYTGNLLCSAVAHLE